MAHVSNREVYLSQEEASMAQVLGYEVQDEGDFWTISSYPERFIGDPESAAAEIESALNGGFNDLTDDIPDDDEWIVDWS